MKIRDEKTLPCNSRSDFTSSKFPFLAASCKSFSPYFDNFLFLPALRSSKTSFSQCFLLAGKPCINHLSFLVLQVEAPAFLQQVGSLLVSMGQDQRTWENFSSLWTNPQPYHYGWIELILLPVFLSSNGRMSFIPREAMACHTK